MWLRAFVTDVEQMYPTVQFLLVPLKKLCLYQIFVCGKRGFSRIRNIPRAPRRAARRNADWCPFFFALSFLTITQSLLTHLFPMHPLSTPWEHQKALRFSDVFGGLRKGVLGTNGLILYCTYALCCSSCFTYYLCCSYS